MNPLTGTCPLLIARRRAALGVAVQECDESEIDNRMFTGAEQADKSASSLSGSKSSSLPPLVSVLGVALEVPQPKSLVGSSPGTGAGYGGEPAPHAGWRWR